MELRNLLATVGIWACLVYCASGYVVVEEDADRYHPAKAFASLRQGRRQEREMEEPSHWKQNAQERLKAKIGESKSRIEKQAKNTIMFLGDGMSLPTVTASRIFKGQKEELQYGGEEGELHIDTFPHTALSKTYCTDSQVADSACSATAYLCGVKGNTGTIGVTSDVLLNDCKGQMTDANRVSSLVSWAQAAGKSTGVVTTTRITHASPAGAYAHIAHRDWESDSKIPPSLREGCDDIALQLISRKPGQDINVILGGGRSYFLNITTPDPEGGYGNRLDGKNLVEEWKAAKADTNGQYVYSRDELLAIDPTKVDNLLGLFSPTHIAYQLDPAPRDNDPTLSEMTKVAIQILSRNPKGYFLFVEGGRIDHAHHDNSAQNAFEETLEFDKSIKLADEMTNDDDTLIVITSDHAHVMTINGYPHRGNPLLHIAGISDRKNSSAEGLPYPTISYANGPGQPAYQDGENGECEYRDITDDDFYNAEYLQLAMVPLGSETHGGDDVMIFAKGPFAHLYSGVQEQSFIPHVMAYAACIGDGEKFCDSLNNNSSVGSLYTNVQLILTTFAVLFACANYYKI